VNLHATHPQVIPYCALNLNATHLWVNVYAAHQWKNLYGCPQEKLAAACPHLYFANLQVNLYCTLKWENQCASCQWEMQNATPQRVNNKLILPACFEVYNLPQFRESHVSVWRDSTAQYNVADHPFFVISSNAG